MHGPVGRLLLTMIPLFMVAGCAARQTVVLVPDPDGGLGKAEVFTAGGSRLLERSGDMTHVSGGSSPPSPVTAADPKYVAATFADLLVVEPLPPERFILFFETGKTVLTGQSQEAVAEILRAIRRRDPLSVSVSGHTDSTGTVQFNDRLSLERAEMVRVLLVRNGTNPDRMTVSSHGKGNPLVPTPDGVAEPRNRRVEVIIR